MKYLIGVGLMIVGGVSTAVTGFMPLAAIVLVGVFLFASFPAEDTFADYILANSDEALVRKRHYQLFLPFWIVSYILTLGRGVLLIPWKEEYFRAKMGGEEEVALTKISRKEYMTLRKEQREIYKTQTLSKKFMQENYSPKGIALKHKKNRLVWASVLAGLMLLMVVGEPNAAGVALTAVYEAVFLPMALLWIAPYKDAKILQDAYDRAMATEEVAE